MTSLLQFTVRQVAETEARFTSVERISYYIRSVPSEAELEIPDRKPAPDWPNGGVIKMSGVKVRRPLSCWICSSIRRIQNIFSPYNFVNKRKSQTMGWQMDAFDLGLGSSVHIYLSYTRPNPECN